MKRFIAFILLFTFILGCALPVSADDAFEIFGSEATVYKGEVVGFSVSVKNKITSGTSDVSFF